MNYEIKTLFKIGDGFVSVDEVLNSPPDPDYIEGAIEWRIGQNVILNKQHWDLVDQLWAYIINGLRELLKHGDYKTYFPDQPLFLGFKMLTGRMVQVTIGDVKTAVERSVMLRSLVEGSTSFFEKMQELVPQRRVIWNNYLCEINRIRDSM